MHVAVNMRLPAPVLGVASTSTSYFSTCRFVRETSETFQEEFTGLLEVGNGEVKEVVRTVGQAGRHTLAIAAVMLGGVALWLLARA